MNRHWLLLLGLAAVSARLLKDPALRRSRDDKQRDLENLIEKTQNCSAWSSTINGVTYPWKTYTFDAKIDHFSFSNTDTYKMRYFVSNCYYQEGGPIFFYTGNEGDLVDFATNTGIMWDLAPQFNAAVIFAEHRFYGESMPFGDKSYTNLENLGLLTSEQALADYADFLIQLKTADNGLGISYNTSTPVVAFGGSYGGMLAAWMRMKYPHLIVGSWASSAPLLYVENGGIPVGMFDNISTRTFTDAQCNPAILDTWWQAILRLSNTTDGQDFINENMNIDNRTLVKNMNDGWRLNYYIREAFEYMAMVDYPYPSSFLTPMPGFPVRVACGFMNQQGDASNFTDEELAMMAYNASQVYYNFDGNGAPYCIDSSLCGDPATAGLGGELGWPWQECSEIIMLMASLGATNDMFWDETNGDLVGTLAAQCSDMFGNLGWNTTVWNLRAVETRFGLSLLGHSNLILTQGFLDPWSGGGFTPSSPGAGSTFGNYIAVIQGSAHHLDLRTPNVCDPPPVSNMRYQIVKILNAWIQQSPINPVLNPLPTWDGMAGDQSQCADINFGYPWGQNENTGESTTAAPTSMIGTSMDNNPTTDNVKADTTSAPSPPTTVGSATSPTIQTTTSGGVQLFSFLPTLLAILYTFY